MKFLIVGLGSMGKRRARLLKAISQHYEIYGVDSKTQRQQEAEMLVKKAYSSIDDALAQHSFDACLVCTAPLSHYEVIRELLSKKLNVFCELNLVSDGYEQLIELAKTNKCKLFLSSTMLYRKETRYIKEQIMTFEGKVNYIYHIGQHLQSWHPWESYQDFFVANAKTSGIREIFAIELPWIVDIFGEILEVKSLSNSISTLEVPYKDSCFSLLFHKNGSIGTIVADVVSQKPVRLFEAVGEGLHLFWEGTPTSLYKYCENSKEKLQIDTYADVERQKGYSDNIVENAYTEELLNFIGVLQGKEQPLYSFEQDKQILQIIDRIEENS